MGQFSIQVTIIKVNHYRSKYGHAYILFIVNILVVLHVVLYNLLHMDYVLYCYKCLVCRLSSLELYFAESKFSLIFNILF